MLQRAAANRCDSGEPEIGHRAANTPTGNGGTASAALTKLLKCISSDSLLDKTTSGPITANAPCADVY